MGIGDTARGAEDAEELVALPADAAEEAKFLEDQSPGNEGEGQKEQQDAACDPTGLLEDAKDVGNKKSR